MRYHHTFFLRLTVAVGPFAVTGWFRTARHACSTTGSNSKVPPTLLLLHRLYAWSGPLPVGFYVANETLGRDVNPTQFFFNVRDGVDDSATAIEAVFFQNSVETFDVNASLAEAQAAQKAIFNLLIGYMALGLLVGIAALGVISARAVVERRHGIGVLRAIGFSRGMVQLSFLAEMSFPALLGIGLGLGLGSISSIQLIDEMRLDEPEVEFVLPWVKVILISVGAYLFSVLTTILPARQAAAIAPAEALRYE